MNSPLPIVHIDLARHPPEDPVGAAFVVIWWHSLPLGQLRLGPEARSAPWFRKLVAEAVAPAVTEMLQLGSLSGSLTVNAGEIQPQSASFLAGSDPLSALDELRKPEGRGVSGSALTVVICTRDRPEGLDRTLRAIAGQRVPPGETIVVDNAPSTAAARDIVRRYHAVRYVTQPIVGLSAARNHGIRNVTTSLVAFTDDDAEPHPTWIGELVRGFAEPSTVAVTGLTLPGSLDSDAQKVFEFQLATFSHGFSPRRYDSSWFETQRRHGAPVWKIGAGVNMAFRSEVFERIGGFDERLGAGRAGCSEDSELWYRLLAAGYSIDYIPSVVVSHFHRSDMEGLNRQLANYSEGHVAALFAQFGRFRCVGDLRRALVSLPRHYIGRWRHRAQYPTASSELHGYFRGLCHWRLALKPGSVPSVVAEDVRGTAEGAAGRRQFLRGNPFPHPRTEGFFFREKMRAIHRVTPPIRATRVLEIGGGQSGLTKLLYPGSCVVNVDLIRDYGLQPENGRPGMAFVAADAVSLPFPDESFDVVTMFDVLEHIADDQSAVCETMRVLRSRGYVLVSSPNETWRFPYYRVMRPFCPSDTAIMREWGHVRRGYRLSRLRQLFEVDPTRTATFLSPGTIVAHDLAFSRLPGPGRRLLILAITPFTRLTYLVSSPSWPGTETASSWPKKVDSLM